MSSTKLTNGGALILTNMEAKLAAVNLDDNEVDHSENKDLHENNINKFSNLKQNITSKNSPVSAVNPDCVPLGKYGNCHNPYTYEVIVESAQYILDRTNLRPKIGIICGSGLGGLADLLDDKQDFPYEKIPHFPVSTVPGHAGKIVVGHMADVPVMCMQGRFHMYEGYPLWKCAMPVRVFKLLGIETLIVTNAAGGLNKTFKIGDIMIIKDHLNLPGFSGESALRGANDDRFGPRFPALNTAYNPKLMMIAKQVASELGMDDYMREGVYTMVGGPSYETIAELRAMRVMGIDAVGMSTIPEVIAARHCGIRCFAFSLITNICITDYDSKDEANHEEVQETAAMRQKDLQRFIINLVPAIRQMQRDNK